MSLMSLAHWLPALPLTPAGQSPAPTAEPAGGADFGSSLRGLIDAVDGSAADANDAVGRMLDGTGDVHEATSRCSAPT